MGFGEAISSCFRKYAVFRGRASRSEYWYFVLFSTIVSFATGFVDGLIGAGKYTPISAVVSLVLLLPRLSVAVRRLHDVNWSGWVLGGFALYAFVTVAVFVASIANMVSGQPDFKSPIGIVAIVMALGFIGYSIWVFVLSVLKGTTGPNTYGEDPLGPSVDVFN